MRTAGQFLQDTPFVDGQIFLSPADMFNSGWTSGPIQNAGGPTVDIANILTSASTTAYSSAALRFLNRTGTQPNYQEQFGTAALVPGPSSVANTSDPLNLVGMPPTKKASLAPLTGGVNGFVPKGIQLNYIDVIYLVATNAISNFALAVYAINYANGVAANKVTLYALNTPTGFPLTVAANPYVFRVPMTATQMFTNSDTKIVIHSFFQSTTSAPSLTFYGLALGVSYNFN